jgi:HlyD family secretion protein
MGTFSHYYLGTNISMKLALPRSRTARIGLAAVVAVVIGAGVWRFVAKGSGPDQQIETAEIDRGEIRKIVSTSGSVGALVMVDVGSQVSGQISELFVDYNSPVTKDQVIAQIDPRTYQTRVQQAQADLVVARATVDVQKANINKAEANLVQAQKNVERNRDLSTRGNVSEAALDIAQSQYESAKADVATAKAQLKNAEANVTQRQAGLESAQIDFDHTKIRSPIDGTVILRSVSVGQTLTAGFQTPTLFQIAQDLTKIQIEASVDEADIGGVREGNPASFTVDAYPQRRFDGEVTQVRLSPTTESNVVTYTVVIAAQNLQRQLFPGMTANVEITTGNRSDAVRVPNAALRFRAPANWIATYAPDFKEDDGQNGGFPAGGAQGGGFGGQGRPAGDFPGARGGDFMSRMFENLPFKLSDVQREAIQNDMQEAFQGVRQRLQGGGQNALGLPGGNNFNEIRQQIQAQRDNIMRRHLTDEQYRQYADYQSQQQQIVRGTLWTLDTSGKPSPHRVRLGINDDRYTEILDTDVKAGDKAIIRVREATDQ